MQIITAPQKQEQQGESKPDLCALREDKEAGRMVLGIVAFPTWR